MWNNCQNQKKRKKKKGGVGLEWSLFSRREFGGKYKEQKVANGSLLFFPLSPFFCLKGSFRSTWYSCCHVMRGSRVTRALVRQAGDRRIVSHLLPFFCWFLCFYSFRRVNVVLHLFLLRFTLQGCVWYIFILILIQRRATLWKSSRFSCLIGQIFF